MERQTLPFGKWFLNRKNKNKNKNYEKRQKNNRSTPGIVLADSRSANKQSPNCAICELGHSMGKFSYIIRCSRLKYPQTPFHAYFPSSVAHSYFDFRCICSSLKSTGRLIFDFYLATLKCSCTWLKHLRENFFLASRHISEIQFTYQTGIFEMETCLLTVSLYTIQR